ncbi:capsular biosynthesis protein [Gammaproteobacteria bacterium]|nr:capsular biosynthesis protein [Gammaproteobacteria bacterium]
MVSENAKPVLVYVRPWNREQFLNIARGCWPGVSLVETSEHPREDCSGLRQGIYRFYRTISADAAPLHLNDDEIVDMILRCRLLRHLPSAEARLLVLACESAVEEVFDSHRPGAMLSITTDSYIQHMFVLACRRWGIPFIGLVPSFINGHFRITAMGERVALRKVSEEQVDAVALKLLNSEYKPAFLVKSSKEIRTNARKLWLRNLLKPPYFALKRRVSGDPLNYHSWSTEVVAQQYWSWRMQDYSGRVINRTTNIKIETQGRPLIFLPLQMSPEATVDYWSQDTRWINYEARVLELLRTYAHSHFFLVKEHPNLLGFRSRDFYARLENVSNAVMISPGVSSNALLELSDGVLAATGTVGFEAALRGVPVYSDSRPFHLPPDTIYNISQLNSPIPAKKIALEQQLVLLRYALESVLPGYFINDGTWNKDKHDQTQIISSLRSVLDGPFRLTSVFA